MAISRVRSLFSLSKRKSNFNSSLLQLSSLRRFSSSSVPFQSERVGFIGLGNMGSRMANNLIKAGYEVAVHDLNQTVMKFFSEKGILTKDSPFEIAETSDIIISMLPSSTHVLDVYTGPNGLLRSGNMLRPWLFVDSSTIDPQTSRRLSAAVANCALKENKDHWETPVMLDAPVSGGVLAAEAGTLTFMVGGLEEAYLAAKRLFLSMGKNTIYCGGAGNGSAAKICNNLALAVSMLGVSEGFALGQSLGISASTLTKIFNSSSARCWSRTGFRKRFLARDMSAMGLEVSSVPAWHGTGTARKNSARARFGHGISWARHGTTRSERARFWVRSTKIVRHGTGTVR